MRRFSALSLLDGIKFDDHLLAFETRHEKGVVNHHPLWSSGARQGCRESLLPLVKEGVIRTPPYCGGVVKRHPMPVRNAPPPPGNRDIAGNAALPLIAREPSSDQSFTFCVPVVIAVSTPYQSHVESRESGGI